MARTLRSQAASAPVSDATESLLEPDRLDLETGERNAEDKDEDPADEPATGLDAEADRDHDLDPRLEAAARGSSPERDSIDPRERSTIALLLQELGEISLLSREQEQAIGLQLVRCRDRIRALLGRWPALVASALPPQRGVPDPAADFRERDTIAVLVFVEEALLDENARPSITIGARELRRWATQLARALGEYRHLRDQLIRANIRLVISLAKRYRRSGVALSDMVQEGVLGLIRAVEKYDPVRDVKFATYAVWWIWQQIGRAGDVHAALIRTPVHWNQLRRKLGRETVRLEHVNGGFVGREELAEAAGIDTGRLDVVTQGFFCVSLDSPTSDDEDRSLGDILPSPNSDPERDQTAADLSERLEEALSKLPEREANILRLRFGTAQSQARTLEEVGHMLGVSRERVRQLEARALRLLLPICQSQGLRSYID